jgi:dienelactone hydrolase
MARFFKILLGFVVVLLIAGTIISTGKQPEPFPENSQSALLLQPGPLPVASFDETFIDPSRPTNANNDYPGSDQRELVGTVWYPDTMESSPYPLVVYSHGFSSNRSGGGYLAQQLASLGYVVVAVDYPLTNGLAPGGPDVKDVVNQPADVSFLIDTLLGQSLDANHPLAGKVDPARIGVTGISLGGMTSTLAAFHPTTGDPRIKAALSIAGPTEQFTEVFFAHREVPFLMLATDTDALVTYKNNALPVIDHVPGAQLVTILQASHTGFAGPAGALRWMNNPDALGCYMVLKNIGDDMSADEPWFELLGTEEQGINYQAKNELCLVDPLPEVMNPLRQQMITSIVVSSFFQSQFSQQDSVRSAAQTFLTETLAGELAEVRYTRAGL